MTAWRFGNWGYSGAVSADWPYQPRAGAGAAMGSPRRTQHIHRVTSADSQVQIASPHRPILGVCAWVGWGSSLGNDKWATRMILHIPGVCVLFATVPVAV